MVTSGNSSLRRVSTSPIDRYGRVATPNSALSAGSGEEHELELPDLELVAVAQRDLGLDALPVEVGAVERADVAELVPLAAVHDLGVATRHGDVVEEDVAVGVTAGFGDVAVEHELRPGVGTSLDDQHADALGQLVERDGELVLRLTGGLDGHEGDG